jgi:HlyD family secretion protein
VLGADKKPRAILVTTGATDGSRTEVTSTELKPDMEVLVGVKSQAKKTQ